jgi:NADH:ubiquinone oxidoreductase subunit E
MSGQQGCSHGCSCQDAPEPSEAELLARLDEVITQYRDRPGALIPVLQIAQGIFGYLPDAAMKRVARGLDKSFSEVAGVVSFYSFFSTVPRGDHIIRLCLGTACYVRGGSALLDAFQRRLRLDVGGTTPDRQFSLSVARCFGACGLAPAIMIDDTVYHRVKTNRIQKILADHVANPMAPKEEERCPSELGIRAH